MKRIDRLTAPPVVGRYYLVPTVHYRLRGLLSEWPVIGRRHDDAEHLRFNHLHYHLDARFLGKRQLQAIETQGRDIAASVASVVIVKVGDAPPARPIWRARRCKRGAMAWPHQLAEKKNPGFAALRCAYEGRQARRGRGGWLCPHRHVSLGSLPAVAGVITCPLHGLRIDAETGVVGPPFPSPSRRPD